jgi:DNA-binding NtrC family response regulator
LVDHLFSASDSKLAPAASLGTAEAEALSVLVVDDEKNVREGLARVLARKGYRTRVAADTESAIAALRNEGFDAVITDLRMPGRDGLQLLREAKELWPDVQFIIMTAYGEIKSYLEARHQGAVEYFNKPVRIDDLIAVLTGIRFRQMHRRHGDSGGSGTLGLRRGQGGADKWRGEA